MLKQRRRWMSGTIADDDLLPVWYRPLYFTRVVAWAFSPIVPLLAVTGSVLPGSLPLPGVYGLLSIWLILVLFVYMLGGVITYRKHPVVWPLFLLMTPVAVIVHALGAMWGVLHPVEEFEVTEKVEPDRIEAVNTGLDDGELSEHEGTDRLVRDSSEEFDRAVFDH